jgi:hypothetical protein
VEVFSRQPELGKTSIALEFLKAAQRAGLRTLYDDVERTMTLQYPERVLGVMAEIGPAQFTEKEGRSE